MDSFVVHLKVHESGGHLFASSPEVPGLHVTGADREALRSVAMKAIVDLFQRNRRMAVKVSPTDDLTELRVRPV